jgi:hypothetical protein
MPSGITFNIYYDNKVNITITLLMSVGYTFISCHKLKDYYILKKSNEDDIIELNLI